MLILPKFLSLDTDNKKKFIRCNCSVSVAMFGYLKQYLTRGWGLGDKILLSTWN